LVAELSSALQVVFQFVSGEPPARRQRYAHKLAQPEFQLVSFRCGWQLWQERYPGLAIPERFLVRVPLERALPHLLPEDDRVPVITPALKVEG
jgi:hypothetical protein